MICALVRFRQKHVQPAFRAKFLFQQKSKRWSLKALYYFSMKLSFYEGCFYLMEHASFLRVMWYKKRDRDMRYWPKNAHAELI